MLAQLTQVKNEIALIHEIEVKWQKADQIKRWSRREKKSLIKFTINNNGPLSNPSSFSCLSVSKSMLNNTTYGLKPIKFQQESAYKQKSVRTEFSNLNHARKQFCFNFSFNLCHRIGVLPFAFFLSAISFMENANECKDTTHTIRIGTVGLSLPTRNYCIYPKH